MGEKGQNTRERICDVTESLILQYGFAGVSIERILKEAKITKGGFFYHFKSKNDLALKLLERKFERDTAYLEYLFHQVDAAHSDPLQRMLEFLTLFSKEMACLRREEVGCIVAAVASQPKQFDESVNQMAAECVLNWRRIFSARFHEIAEHYPIAHEASIPHLSDMLSVLVEGGILFSRVLSDNTVLAEQILIFRSHVMYVFKVDGTVGWRSV